MKERTENRPMRSDKSSFDWSAILFISFIILSILCIFGYLSS